MYAPINQIQSPDDEEEERDDVVGDCKEPLQESFLSYYNHNFGQAQDLTAKSLNPKCADHFACFNAVATPSNPFKFSYERLIEEGFDLPSPKKKRRSETAVDGGGGGGGRVVRATGSKDRHSKVRTARGPRDRRVRLSPTTAIEFYDVQDRLGYDRPSKAIDWLIKEAQTAIDALDNQQQSVSLSQRGMREKQDDSLVSNFSCFVDAAAEPPSAAALEAYLDQNGFCSALNSTPQILETNWEMARLQKMFTWNSVNENSGNARGGCGGAGGGGGAEYSPCNSLPPHAAAQPILGHTNLVREPLQSSMINYAPSINNDFAGFNFSDELSKIADSAKRMKN